MRIESQKFTFFHVLVTAVLAVLVVVIIALIPRAGAVTASTERLITIHDRGEETGLITEAKTLRDVFNEADITLDKNDLVEPGIDEELVGNNYQVNIYRARPVVIIDGMTKQLVMTAYQTPKQIADHAGIDLHDEDNATIELTDNMLSDGASERMVIDRATELKLVLYGEAKTVYTQASTVKDFLDEKSITLDQKDKVSVDADKAISAGMVIEIWREGKQIVTREEKIEPPVRQIQDADREVGYRKVKTVGVPGKKLVTYQVFVKNGEEVKKKAIKTVVLEKATEQVEIVGAKPSFSGGFAAALAKLRACESGGNYQNKNNPLYRGAYQFSYATWANKFGIYDPADASEAQQDQAARETYLRRGWQPWPHCGAGLPDSYR